MMKCPSCGTENPDDSQYCDDCGAHMLNAQKSTVAPRIKPQFSEEQNVQSSNVTSVGIPIFVGEKPSGGKTSLGKTNNDNSEAARRTPTTTAAAKAVHATLLIERGANVGAEFRLTEDESYLGRWDADNGIFPDIDLDTHDPEAKISRRHARIVCEKNKYAVEDLGSTNGTFINRGRRLIPGIRQPLNDGDEIIVGKTFLRFHIVDK